MFDRFVATISHFFQDPLDVCRGIGYIDIPKLMFFQGPLDVCMGGGVFTDPTCVSFVHDPLDVCMGWVVVLVYQK